MKRIVLATTALALLIAPTAGAETGAPGRVVEQRPHREILARGVVVRVSPISVRASIGSVVTCEVRNRALVAGLSVGDRVKMKCIGVDGRWVLRRLVVHPPATAREPAAERSQERSSRVRASAVRSANAE